jgi:hypothetical protein
MACMCKDPKPALVWIHLYPPLHKGDSAKDSVEAGVRCPGCGAGSQIGGYKPSDEELRPSLWLPPKRSINQKLNTVRLSFKVLWFSIVELFVG